MADPEHLEIAMTLGTDRETWDEVLMRSEGGVIDLSEENLTGSCLAGVSLPGPVNCAGAKFLANDPTDPGKANFCGTTFECSADFTRAIFAVKADFTGATFSGRADFTGATFSDGVDFTGATFAGEADFTGATFSAGADFPGGSFPHEVKFSKASFGGLVDFSDRKFKGPAFFHGVDFSQGVEFGNVDSNFTGFRSNDANLNYQALEQGYRALKLAMNEQQARTEEAAFAALELKARRHRLKAEAKKKKLGLQRFLSWAERCGYWVWEKLSDSGRSFFGPLLLYITSGFAFAALYVLPCQNWSEYWPTGIRYAFLKQFPFATAFRGGTNRFSDLETALFGTNFPPGWVDALNAAQSITALVLIFLMGLGIRHKFRMRSP